MSSPQTSVILTTYNQAPWLRRAIESVLEQTVGDWELLLVDNGSTDDSPQICAEYTDPRIRFRRYEVNEHHTKVCNDAIREARGELIALLYGDDYYLPRKLEVQAAKLASLPATVCGVYCSTYERDDATGELTLRECGRSRGALLREWLETGVQPFMPIAPLVRRSAMLEFPYYEQIFMEGEGVFNKLAFKYEFDFVPDVLGVMTSHANNMGKAIDKNLKACDTLFGMWFDDARFPPELQFLRGRVFANLYALNGWQAIRRERRYADGGRWLWQAVRYDSSVLKRWRVALGLALSRMSTRRADQVLDAFDLVKGVPAGQPEGRHPT